eukprot:2947692-Rhodomonas_salina.1
MVWASTTPTMALLQPMTKVCLPLLAWSTASWVMGPKGKIENVFSPDVVMMCLRERTAPGV